MNLKRICHNYGQAIAILLFSFIWTIGNVYILVTSDVPTYGIENNFLYWLVYWPMIAIVLYLQSTDRNKEYLER